MSNRTVRVNELIQRELNDILRKRHQSEAAAVTVTEVRVAPDLRDGRAFISVIGDEQMAEKKLRWIRSIAAEISQELSRRIVLKYMPRMTYVLDRSLGRASRLEQVMDEIERQAKSADESGE
ncbi:30S ribosome-binding factor RbfA [Horticoccus luteus]|uniref:Ribosome-binding factor A n=1 Tax=Horticoccus luteus TaxID=2862869 RepID=A0A8F9TWF8_9BACT|nr:30S ribosome-binding factor RbfA [Horticoccus luteus]QYM80371.1 30S ribosome-binding factor RbfA [Horticoccus luteus]